MRALASDPEHGRLYELVDIFAHSTLDAYLGYHGRNAAYLAELGVDHDRSVETMRLLTLCSLSSDKTVVTYGDVAAALQVSARSTGLGLRCPSPGLAHDRH